MPCRFPASPGAPSMMPDGDNLDVEQLGPRFAEWLAAQTTRESKERS